jgi:hypothetical protein
LNSIQNIQIRVSTDSGTVLHVERVKALQEKFSFLAKDEGFYRICVEYTGSNWQERSNIYFKLKIMSDNMDEPNIAQAIKQADLDPVHQKLNDVLKKSRTIVKQQELALDTENTNANQQMGIINYYYYLTVLQIIIVIVLGIYQVFSFRKFLVKNYNI